MSISDGYNVSDLDPDQLKRLENTCRNQAIINKKLDWFDGLPPLHMAIQLQQYKLVRVAINNGADLNIICDQGYFPVHYLAESGNKKILDDLRTAFPDMDMNLRTLKGDTPLIIAVANGHDDFADSMISYGADINLLDKNGNNLLFFALSWRAKMVHSDEPSEFIFTLIRNMSIESLSSPDNVDGRTVLHQAAERDEYDVVEELIRRGVNVNVRAADGSLPLTLAVEEDSWCAAVELVKAGAEGVDELLDNGLTPLTKAVLEGEREILEAIAESGNVDLDKVFDSGKTHRQLLDECCKELGECHADSLEQQILTAEEVYAIFSGDDS